MHLGTVFYFLISLSSLLISPNKEFPVNFTYDLVGYSPNDFVVRSFMTPGSIEIYDRISDSWVPEYAPWPLFPRLEDSLYVRVVNFVGPFAQLCFEAKNIYTAEVYETPCIKIWNREISKDYLQRLNTHILGGTINRWEIGYLQF